MILFRKNHETEAEFDVARKYFTVVEVRTECHLQASNIIIGRYSVLPYYRELERDLHNQGCRLINSYNEHAYIADFDWYFDVQEYTPKTWFDYNFHEAPEGQYVVKGRTNSRKLKWNSQCYANTKKKALEIANILASDSLIGPQGLVYRQFVPLEVLEIGLNEIPYSYEFRFFFLKDSLLSFNYYWSSAQNINIPGDPLMIKFAEKIAKIIAEKVNFFVLDIARTVEGKYILIEINDGQCSGLSENDPDVLYNNLNIEMSKQFGYGSKIN